MLAVENAADRGAVPNADLMELKEELNKNKQALKGAARFEEASKSDGWGFFCCIISMGFLYLLFISR